MGNCVRISFSQKDSQLGCPMKSVVEKARHFLSVDSSKPVQSFLKSKDQFASRKNRRPSHFSTFTNQQIAFAQRVTCVLIGAYIHFRKIRRINLVPLNVNIS